MNNFQRIGKQLFILTVQVNHLEKFDPNTFHKWIRVRPRAKDAEDRAYTVYSDSTSDNIDNLTYNFTPSNYL